MVLVRCVLGIANRGGPVSAFMGGTAAREARQRRQDFQARLLLPPWGPAGLPRPAARGLVVQGGSGECWG